MSDESREVGDNWNKQPGTSKQTGNNAPQFPWSHSSVGRTARIAAMCCAYHLGASDSKMARKHEFPPAADICSLFIKLMPWFPDHYNSLRRGRAEEKGYNGPLSEFNAGDVENRVRYCFAKPGRRGHDPRTRVYGISVEHHDSTCQKKPGGRAEVWARCSKEIMRRLVMGESITIEEAEEWGR